MINRVDLFGKVESTASNTYFGACKNVVFFVITANTRDGFDGRRSFDFKKGLRKVTNGEVVIFNKDETLDLRMVEKYV